MKDMSISELDECEIRRRNKEKWNKQVLSFSVGLFLCLTTTLTAVIVLTNFVIVYETRHMLLTSQQTRSDYQTPYPIPISDITTDFAQETSTSAQTSFDTSTTAQTSFDTPTTAQTSFDTSTTAQTSFDTSTTAQTSFNTSTTAQTSFDTSTASETSFDTSTAAETSLETSTTDVDPSTLDPTTMPPEKVNPVIILNEIVQGLASFACLRLCTDPSVIAAQLNLTLSSTGKDDNFLRITQSVYTMDKRVAKEKVAYLALDYLYKNRVHESWVKDEWNIPVSNDCKPAENEVWTKCAK